MTLPPKVAFWPKLYRELWEERAALMEFEAGYPRRDAEAAAEEDIRKLAAKEPGDSDSPGLPLGFGK